MPNIHRVIGTVAYLGGVTPAEEFCWSWGEMREFNARFLCRDNERIHYTRARQTLHAGARNELAENMLGDWLCMLDTDQQFDPHIVLRLVQLMEQHNLPVLTGLSRHKQPPYHPLWWTWHEAVEGFVPIIEVPPETHLMRVDAFGAGCLLIHRAVFAKMAEVYPEESPFDHKGRYSEDFSFALRCRALGIPVYGTPTVKAEHLRMLPVRDEDYMPHWFDEQSNLVQEVPLATLER